MVDLAVVIVTWNVRDFVADALQSLLDDLKNSQLAYQVLVVDSASTDNTPELIRSQFPDVHVLTSIENLGFGRANNLGMQRLGFDGSQASIRLPNAVYLLNPDTITHPGATKKLYDVLMSNPQVGLVGANLQYEDGSFQHGAFAFPGLRQIWAEFFPTPGRFLGGGFNGRYARELYQSDDPFTVDFVLGATMMLKREVILQTGMFDESFFMYCEEIDWAWRIQQAVWQILCVPGASVTHLSGKSTSQVHPESLINLWQSRLKLYAKYHPQWKYRLARWLIRLGVRRKMKQLEKQGIRTDDSRNVYNAYQTIYEMARTS